VEGKDEFIFMSVRGKENLEQGPPFLYSLPLTERKDFLVRGLGCTL